MAAHILFYYLLLVLVCLASLKWGGRPERAVALVMCIAVILTVAVRSDWVTRFRALELGVFLVDCLALTSFLVISLRVDRWWPLWTSAFQLIATAAHAAKYVNPNFLRAGYTAMVSASAYPHLLFLTIGIINQAARRRGRTAPLSLAGFSAALTTIRKRTKRRS